MRRNRMTSAERRAYQLEVSKLKIEYAKHSSTLFLAFLGGQITLIGTIFKDNKGIDYAVISIIFMLMACLLSFSFSEGVLRQLDHDRIHSEQKWLEKFQKFTFKGTTCEFIKSFITALCVLISVLLFIVFARQDSLLTMF